MYSSHEWLLQCDIDVSLLLRCGIAARHLLPLTLTTSELSSQRNRPGCICETLINKTTIFLKYTAVRGKAWLNLYRQPEGNQATEWRRQIEMLVTLAMDIGDICYYKVFVENEALNTVCHLKFLKRFMNRCHHITFTILFSCLRIKIRRQSRKPYTRKYKTIFTQCPRYFLYRGLWSVRQMPIPC